MISLRSNQKSKLQNNHFISSSIRNNFSIFLNSKQNELMQKNEKFTKMFFSQQKKNNKNKKGKKNSSIKEKLNFSQGIDLSNYDIGKVNNLLKKKEDQMIIFQITPSIEFSLCKEYGLSFGKISRGKIVSALKKLGVDYVFDTELATNFIIVEEAHELLHRLKYNGIMPMFSSSCSPWVDLVQTKYPHFIPNISSTCSPHVVLSSLIKNYWAEKNHIRPEKIKTVSVMRCSLKNDQILRKQNLLKNGLQNIDYVLTSKEFENLFRINNIEWNSLKEINTDQFFHHKPANKDININMFGFCGGLASSILKTAYEIGTGKLFHPIKFKSISGFDYIHEAQIDFNGVVITSAFVKGSANIEKYLQMTENADFLHSFTEFLACEQGCVDSDLVPFFSSSSNSFSQKKLSSDPFGVFFLNPSLQKLYQEFLGKPRSEKSKKLLNINYSKK
ncbi:iron hydrogenase [Anaeramoeba ignava]|uniref:Iron hydrogenase n=1 Tax=Anaeramoeba ignava TaxID=1746090 RepID=A0A9Q0L8I9_ANAIG|nr:iron hydrogenase [Anaeramoeba ignava]